MGRRTKTKLIIRSLILVTTIIVSLVNPYILSKIMGTEIFGNIKLYHLLWVYLMCEMIVVLVPKYNNYTYSGKLFKRHYDEVNNFKSEKLKSFTKKNYLRALRALVFWVGLNSILGWIYIKFKLSPIYMYLLFLFYYWSDMFCVNVWCPFHKIIVQNKCCNECRIYNWGHIMYLTPLIFIPNLWTYSLVFVAIVIFIQWEILNYKYPERFSSISNKNLRCTNCVNECRYNKEKNKKVEMDKSC